MRWTWLLVTVALFCAPAEAEEKKYTLKDLSALEELGSWAELVEHLDDVPPSGRTGPWLKICEKAAVQYLASLSADREPYAALSAAEAFPKRYPQLSKSRSFMDKRAEAGLKGFEACFAQSGSGGECVERLLPFVDADPKNKDLALKAGKLVRRNQFAYVAVPFFSRALDGRKDAKECVDDDVKLAIVAGLGLPESDPRVAQARTVASDVCWKALEAPIMDDFNKSTPSSYVFRNACDFLKAKKKLGNLQSQQCSAKSSE
jgi:hypothetical protein